MARLSPVFVLAALATVGIRAEQWVRIFQCDAADASATLLLTPQEISSAAQWSGARLRITPLSGDDPDFTIISNLETTPVQSVRKAAPQTLSHSGALGATSPHTTPSEWQGTSQATARANVGGASGGPCGAPTVFGDPAGYSVFWACNHPAGIHLFNANPYRCGWTVHGEDAIAVDLLVPSCDVPPSEWLETAFEPFLDIAGSGFVAGSIDLFRFSFDYHRKYNNRVFSTGADASLQTVASDDMDPADASLGNCYDNIKLDIQWGDLVPFCSRDDVSDPAFVIYTCKVMATGEEDLDPIRGEGLTRVVHNELPVYIKFPKQTSASIGDLSAFRPPDVQAAIVRQEVNVAVNTLDVQATVRLFTSVQYPFQLTTPTWDETAPTPTGISPGNAPFLFTNCGPPDAATYPQGGDSPGQPGDQFACNQVWELDLDVAGGANPATSKCDLDGLYKFHWEAACVPTFPSDCPLVQDDQGVLLNRFEIEFTLDSEYFCPQVVDTVEVAASISVWKDLAHSTAATNFILGQTVYLVVDVTSPDVTVVGAQLDDLSYEVGAGDVDVVVDKAVAALPPADAVQSLLWYDSGTSIVGVGTVPDNQVWIQFKVTNPPFTAPVDGSKDFSVSVTLDVQFKNALMLLQADGVKTQKLGATATSSFAASDDDDTSSAPSKLISVAAAGVVGLAAALE